MVVWLCPVLRTKLSRFGTCPHARLFLPSRRMVRSGVYLGDLGRQEIILLAHSFLAVRKDMYVGGERLAPAEFLRCASQQKSDVKCISTAMASFLLVSTKRDIFCCPLCAWSDIVKVKAAISYASMQVNYVELWEFNKGLSS